MEGRGGGANRGEDESWACLGWFGENAELWAECGAGVRGLVSPGGTS